MAPSQFGIIGRFFGNTVSEAAAFAAGVALGPVLGPPVEAIRQSTWEAFPFKIPDVGVLASGVAQGQVDADTAKAWAKKHGFDDVPWAALVAIADTGPGAAYAFELWRRNEIDEPGFRRALKRAAIEQEWIDALVKIKRRLLSPAELANAVVQGFKTEPDAAADALLQGYSGPDFQTMVDVTGLPPGPETLLEWERRGIITKAELEQGIKEGHTKVKYIPFYEAALTRVLSAAEYAGLRLRGWITAQESYTGGALTGYSQAQMDQLFLNRGRPATPRQIRVGYARGAKIQGFAGDVTAAINRATQQSDIRPEYEDIEVAASYSLPSPFVLRGLTASGAFTEAQAEKILIESGWLPEYATAAAAFFAKGTTAKTGEETKSELADEYIEGFITEAEYRAALTALGYTGHEQDLEVLHAEAAAIKTERARVVTAIHKAYMAGSLTEAQAGTKLVNLGMHDVAIQRALAYWNIEKA